MNPAGERVLGYAEAEILTMNVRHIVAPEYRGLFKRMIERTLDAQTQFAQEIEILTKDGRKLTVEVNSHPIQHLGRTVEVQVVARYAALNLDFETSCYMGTREISVERRVQNPLAARHAWRD
jgi:PAS domain-containing protein